MVKMEHRFYWVITLRSQLEAVRSNPHLFAEQTISLVSIIKESVKKEEITLANLEISEQELDNILQKAQAPGAQNNLALFHGTVVWPASNSDQ